MSVSIDVSHTRHFDKIKMCITQKQQAGLVLLAIKSPSPIKTAKYSTKMRGGILQHEIRLIAVNTIDTMGMHTVKILTEWPLAVISKNLE